MVVPPSFEMVCLIDTVVEIFLYPLMIGGGVGGRKAVTLSVLSLCSSAGADGLCFDGGVSWLWGKVENMQAVRAGLESHVGS